MTNKLTAKLSDGTEWEVLDRFDNRFYGQSDFTTAFSVRPIKKEPPEWWQVQSALDRGFLCSRRFESEADAKMSAKRRNEVSGSNAYFVVHVREVVG